MRVNTTTLLWEDLSPQDMANMQGWTEDVLFRGKLAYPEPPWLLMWYEAMEYDARQRVMLTTTVVPARVLLSIVHQMQKTSKCQK